MKTYCGYTEKESTLLKAGDTEDDEGIATSEGNQVESPQPCAAKTNAQNF